MLNPVGLVALATMVDGGMLAVASLALPPTGLLRSTDWHGTAGRMWSAEAARV